MGAIQGAFDAFLGVAKFENFALRMKAHAENAHDRGKFLEFSSKVEKVIYPGLKSHPQHELAKRTNAGLGGMITFYIKGGLLRPRSFLENRESFFSWLKSGRG
jgi:cystathionine gamma-lyase